MIRYINSKRGLPSKTLVTQSPRLDTKRQHTEKVVLPPGRTSGVPPGKSCHDQILDHANPSAAFYSILAGFSEDFRRLIDW